MLANHSNFLNWSQMGRIHKPDWYYTWFPYQLMVWRINALEEVIYDGEKEIQR